MSRVIRATHVWTIGGTVADVSVEVDDTGTILDVRRATAEDPPAERGLLIPGLVNAHTHLELSWLEGQIPGGEGFISWGTTLQARRRGPSHDVQRSVWQAVRAMQAAGTALVCDISNTGGSVEALGALGVSGVVQREFMGMHGPDLPEKIRRAQASYDEVQWPNAKVYVRPSPHALYSTPPDLVLACLRGPWGADRPPATIHLAEDGEEVKFLKNGSGAWPKVLNEMGIDWSHWHAPRRSPVEALSDLAALGPDLMVVHGVYLSTRDIAKLAFTNTPLVLCARSNEHIGGQLADVPALMAAGVRLCLGTDSLASCPDLDVLAEIPVLAAAYPEVEAGSWLDMATAGGAYALRIPGFGAILEGLAPGLVLLEDVEDAEDLTHTVPTRRWLVPPGKPT
jgi:cytosine/adenosine deaminase-related metal-dependent hydrolase